MAPTRLRALLAPPLLLLLVPHAVMTLDTPASQPPNIIIVIADDLGWNDVGFHGSNQIPTPNIDALAYSGVILNNYYTMPVCTPSRAALMTGRHPIHTGMQHRVIFGYEPWGLGLEEKLLPEHLRERGYATHLVGKWHLGHFHANYTPTFRGFDSHYGYWTGRQDYYDHTAEETARYWGYDMRRGMNESRAESFGQYTTHLLRDEAVRVVAAHDSSKPLFLMVAHLAVHSANRYMPLQAPQHTIQRFAHIQDLNRRIYAAMLTELDDAVGSLVGALGARGLLHNSVLLFTTDNGGPAGGFNLNAASNWPLRGTKDGMWEGGVRGAALLWSPLLPNTPRVSHQLMHIQDWLPTLLSATGSPATPEEAAVLDGHDLWEALADPRAQTYRQLLLAIDNQRGLAALRSGRWKLFFGTVYDGHYDSVLGPSGREGEYNVSAVQHSLAARTLAKTASPLPCQDLIAALRLRATLTCPPEEEVDPELLCRPITGETCLFDIESDPCESRNLAGSHAVLLRALLAELQAHNASVVPQRNQPLDPASNPKFWGYSWTNWRDFSEPPPLALQTYISQQQALEEEEEVVPEVVSLEPQISVTV